MMRKLLKGQLRRSLLLFLIFIQFQRATLVVAQHQCLAPVTQKSLTGKASVAIRILLSSLILSMLPAPKTQAGIVNVAAQENKTSSVLTIGPENSDLRLEQCLFAQNPADCGRFEIRVKRYIDHFVEPKQGSLVQVTPQQKTASRSFTADVLGGERDVNENLRSPQGAVQSEVLPPNPRTNLVHRQIQGAEGDTVLVYNGADESAEINKKGLGGIDLRKGGVDQFEFYVSSDQSGTVKIQVYDVSDDKAVSTATIKFIANRPGIYQGLFADFVGNTNFSTVGAFSFTIHTDNKVFPSPQGEQPPPTGAQFDYFALAGPTWIPGTSFVQSSPRDQPIVAVFGPAVQYPNPFGGLSEGIGEFGGFGGFGFGGGLPYVGGFLAFLPNQVEFPSPILSLPAKEMNPTGSLYPPYVPPENPPPYVTSASPEPNSFTMVVIAALGAGAYRGVRSWLARPSRRASSR